MPRLDFTLHCPIHDSFRVQQVAGMFDVPLAQKASTRIAAEVPDLAEDWQIGLIVGPSGSGKSTLARRAFGSALYERGEWPRDRAVIDCFGDLATRDITQVLTAVGFSSPPSWIKPYHVLSGGEQFRCDLARALCQCGMRSSECGVESRSSDIPHSPLPTPHSELPTPHSLPLVVFDEFTSVVDRNVARLGSAAVAKAIRGGQIACRFVAVSCHYDIAEWLAPDWVLDMAAGTLERRRLRRPDIHLEIFRTKPEAWTMFARHHYLSGSLSPAARTYLAAWRDVPVSFCATLPLIGRRNHRRISRIVTLPDFQGIGIGLRVAEAVAQLHRDEGLRVNITASHPSVIGHCRRSSLWRTTRVMRTGSRDTERFIAGYRNSRGRAVVSFEYLGQERKADVLKDPGEERGARNSECGTSRPDQ
jgi:GNAT superfamily N-acetyltransferase